MTQPNTKSDDTKAAAKAAEKTQPAKTGATVTVALKHPTGIHLDELRQEEGHEPVLGGGFRETKVWRPTGRRHTINGTRVPFGAVPNFPILCGYALTHGVPKDLWENWLKHHPDSDLVSKKLVFAFDSGEDAAAAAREHESTRSGLEPLKRGDDPRVDKVRTRDGKFVDKVQVADEQPSTAA